MCGTVIVCCSWCQVQVPQPHSCWNLKQAHAASRSAEIESIFVAKRMTLSYGPCTLFDEKMHITARRCAREAAALLGVVTIFRRRVTRCVDGWVACCSQVPREKSVCIQCAPHACLKARKKQLSVFALLACAMGLLCIGSIG